MKTIKLFLKFSFTSLSPDAQPISLAVVSEDITSVPASPINVAKKVLGEDIFTSKNFYSEFSDFDLNRCDDWVKENVIKKLVLEKGDTVRDDNEWQSIGDIDWIKQVLKEWLSQFSEYEITFVTDCGWFNWYWMVQLLAEWEINDTPTGEVEYFNPDEEESGGFDEGGRLVRKSKGKVELISRCIYRTGLPVLPTNISPVPEDLNDLIARVKGISVREAFDLNREELAYLKIDLYGESETECFGKRIGDTLEIERIQDQKYNALFDARVIKEIYQKLR